MPKSPRLVYSLICLIYSLWVCIPSALCDPLFLDRCPTPRIDMIMNVTESSAEISWTQSDSALTVDLEWRELGSPDWTTLPDVQSPFILMDLSACTEYEIRLQAHCNGSDSEPSQSIVFEADGCCRIPTGLRYINSAESQVTIFWDEVVFAFAHHIRYRELGAMEWIEMEVDNNVLSISNLLPCTAYEMQVGSQCDLDSTDFSSSLIFQTLDCGVCTDLVYCTASADDGASEWIDSVAFGSLRLRSGSNQGYLLQNTIQTGIERQRTYSFHVAPAATFPGAQFYLRMWIDLDQDGLFTDSTELLVDPETSITSLGYTQEIALEDTVNLGATRMRIALKSIIGTDTIKPSSCGNFLFGEVEDYCISIDDLCPEIQPVVESVTETSAVISWVPVDESIVFIYRYRNINEGAFGEPELTQDTIIEISGLEKCETYVLQTLSVCVQDTSSWQEFMFETECPDGVHDILPVGESARLYPNPFTDQLTLSLRPLINGTGIVRLLTMYGAEVSNMDVTFYRSELQQIQIHNLDRLPHGMYLVSIQSGARRQVFKVIK